MKPKIYFEYVLTLQDKKGKKIYSVKKESESLLMNFVSLLFCQFRNNNINFPAVDNGNLVNFSGTLRGTAFSGFAATASALACDGALNDDITGIEIGSGTTLAVAPNNYSLQTRYTTANFQFLAQGGNATSVVGNDSKLSLRRVFVNIGVAALNVTEIGLVAKPNAEYFLIARDLLSPVVSVGSGQSFTVEYILTVTA